MADLTSDFEVDLVLHVTHAICLKAVTFSGGCNCAWTNCLNAGYFSNYCKYFQHCNTLFKYF